MAGPERRPIKTIVRFDSAEAQAIEDWRTRQKPVPDATEAIHRLIAMGLASAPPPARRGKKTGVKASELAGEMIDWLSDSTAPAEERAKRKRRLIKGPSEFREMRSDHRKPKD
ncbi:MAG: hypothetical protein QOH67_2484 [Hyphomicrobiales bacterium]|nr:hypothetical protein [Hyphomicrobiales bacterium]